MGTHKVIGVLGGMGPAATVEFFRRLVAATPATIDQDHLHILIDNDPTVPDRTRAILHGGPSPEPVLVNMARRLQGAGAEVLALPCNTAHVYLDAIRKGVTARVVNMIAETVASVGEEAVGLLATSGTIDSRLYHRACEEHEIRLILPSEDGQRTIVRAIEAIKASRSFDEVEAAVARVSTGLRKRGANAVVAGCTELSLLDGASMTVRWIDALDCLVAATIREAFREDAGS